VLVEGQLLLLSDASIEEAPPELVQANSVECGKENSAYPVPTTTRSGFNITIVTQESWSAEASPVPLFLKNPKTHNPEP
jgi:hypothetical protein